MAEALEARFRACHLQLVAARDRLQARLDAEVATKHERTRLDTVNDLLTPVSSAEVDALGNVVEVQRYRRFLSVDLEGQGRAVEVLGELAAARNLAVLVPGMGNSLETFSGQADRGQAIRHESGPGTAVVVWLDYDSPQGVREAMSKKAGLDGGPRLSAFLTELSAMKLPEANTTLVGHSYGSEVVGQALLNGAHADRVVLTGSPGIDKHVGQAADLVAPPTRVYVERAPGDYVSYTQWHGPDPADFPDAIRMATADPVGNDEAVSVHWHNEYYRTNSESLRNVGRVVRGDLARITRTDTTPAQETKLAWGPGLRMLSGAAGKVYDGVAALSRPSRAAARQAAGTDGARVASRPAAPTHSRRPGGPQR
ncbi:alpha/beta hydrolase [Kribbella sp. CA-293567]|uniref:alpha/beta hydrolase n=1 Tax=Kribbella sp. CA-293567 TaxID=3002436 RepID=UPI0022DE7A11|nr:alpha/beta hydrolase [Kribbella sp. CA-293567]WBQ05673.1 alpha/beta hydrolase [Kribbella sp. CA-293567]